MSVNLQLGASCKSPEEGDVYIDEQTMWASTGYFRLVFFDDRVKHLRTIPLTFASSLCVKEFIEKISVGVTPISIQPITQLKISR